ncbi:hypothetical protein HCN44_007872 [Aphidius gifuensis]|uniref:3-hydroxyisobutyryl-CoA hydrolase, mitochondrial n=2 Tax=Aphidius gifuensis TaxID=684658 RepID=A0A834XYA6_APHGI|nr:hypothetical protein HCN44_007872 [Aphidius gifuensis]
MMSKSLSTLTQWELIKQVIVVKGAEENVFSAGGDIKERFFFMKKPDGRELDRMYFSGCIRLLEKIGTYKKPYVSLISGIAMGGGAGVSVLVKYRVATETTLFSTPETSIGLFPNSGCTYFLPRLEGKLGWYLGLTGHHLKGLDVKLAGIATHFVPASKLQALTDALLSPGNQNVEEILKSFDEHDPAAEFSLAKYSKQIDECFSGDTVEEIIYRLKVDGSEWAQSVIHTLQKISPTSLKVTLEALKRSINMISLTEYLEMESNLTENMIMLQKSPDFQEGVRALLVDKNHKPIWNPRNLEDVTDQYIDSLFTKAV